MVVALVIAGYVTTLLLAVLAVSNRRDQVVRSRVRAEVIVTMKTGEAFRGVLMQLDGRSLVLRQAKALTDASARPVPVDGELILDRAQIDYMQKP